ncbi:hypothetical protein DERP_005031 [Dermatophagoides pteronyssinus]|uniref:Uncharacterized protein n=1 Tax=Dermatophagoides pteronyssinus TaxID=6956 RepID=A0ABQ8JT77_DERPT|nr:hypothetical protein DERP_005031 [Dermatophagoides pteronyssinus]
MYHHCIRPFNNQFNIYTNINPSSNKMMIHSLSIGSIHKQSGIGSEDYLNLTQSKKLIEK